MRLIELRYDPPSHGWLTLHLTADSKRIVIDASHVPNNPLQELVVALETVARGRESAVWWHLEPDGYFTTFKPLGSEVRFNLEFAAGSVRQLARPIVSLTGPKAQVLLPFWRFLRDFQSRSYQESDWPEVDFSRMEAVKTSIETTK